MRTLAACCAAVLVLACVMYAARGSQVLAHWHPMFVEPALHSVGLSWFGHEHTRHEHPSADGVFTDGAPVTSCWHYDFLERDCDGPDHYKALVSGSKIGAYKGDPSPIVYPLPLRAKACATTADGREHCVSDWIEDSKTVWLDTGGRIVEHRLAIACPGPHFELPCKSKDY